MSLIFPASLFFQILKIHENLEHRLASEHIEESQSLVKQAFDTRRFNQETDINPRRNLQYYSRSEPFINTEMANKIQLLFKVKIAADLIKNQFWGDPDWLDSNIRVLSNALNTTLRVEQKDYDFSDPQFDYLDQLLYLRYRLGTDQLKAMNEEQIKTALLQKDEKLMHKSIFAQYKPAPKLIAESSLPSINSTIHTKEVEKSGADLLDKLFGVVKATQENKNVERSVTITIKDSINDPEKKIDKLMQSED